MRTVQNHRRLLLLWFFLWCGLSVQAQTVTEIAQVDKLLGVLAQRLELADGAAQAKWNSGAPIEDVEREEQVLQRFADEASALGVEQEFARRVMRAQIEASKVRQRELFRQWRAHRLPPFANPPNLTTEIRPKLDDLSVCLLTSLHDTERTLRTYPELLAWRASVVWGSKLSAAEQASLEPFRSLLVR